MDGLLDNAAPPAEGAAVVADSPADGLDAIRNLDAIPECIQQWKESTEKRLQEAKVAEEKAIADLEVAAKSTLDDHEKKFEKKVATTAETNAENEKDFIAKMTEGGFENAWEKVAFMIDFNAKTVGRDTSQMKSLLIKLKSEGLVRK
mmetsp:Transcript_14872/g.38127  ORF Transcript_14872/g.38127 Transcript_14872/m.38127 type:complete len:147 (-) Transcript_14872:1901-2341(-)